MKSKLLALIVGAMAFLCAPNVYPTDLRGRVDGYNPYTRMSGSVPGVSVALFVVYPNGQYGIVRQTVTGPDGMYYLTGIYPGQYVLQVGGLNYPLIVVSQQLQDIPIITRTF
jgi:hypothetical protein